MITNQLKTVFLLISDRTGQPDHFENKSSEPVFFFGTVFFLRAIDHSLSVVNFNKLY